MSSNNDVTLATIYNFMVDKFEQIDKKFEQIDKRFDNIDIEKANYEHNAILSLQIAELFEAQEKLKIRVSALEKKLVNIFFQKENSLTLYQFRKGSSFYLRIRHTRCLVISIIIHHACIHCAIKSCCRNCNKLYCVNITIN